MTRAIYPAPFFQKMLAIEAPGGAPSRLSLVVPSIVTPTEPFAVKVAVLDESGYPSLEYEGDISIHCPTLSPATFEIAFAKGKPAVGVVQGVRPLNEGTVRLEAEFCGDTVYSNPLTCRASSAQRVYWGDPHVHTLLSDCVANLSRTIDFAYTAARWVTGLDWCAVADHVSNGRTSLGKWRSQIAASTLYDDPPAFATLPAYEASLPSSGGGDNNVHLRLWTDRWVDHWEQGNVRTLCQALAEQLPEGDFFVVPHHTSRAGKHGEISDDIYPGPERMPVIEIHSKWGTSEYAGNPNALKRAHLGPAYAVDLLNQGLRLGFIGGTDSHSTMPSGYGEDALAYSLPGFTAVCTDKLSRDSVFDAIRMRRCYATSVERIFLDVSIAGAGFGELVRRDPLAGPRELTVTAAAKSDIVSMEIVRNGLPIHLETPNTWKSTLCFTDTDDLEQISIESPHLGRFVYYYARVTCASGAQAWGSPVWLVF